MIDFQSEMVRLSVLAGLTGMRILVFGSLLIALVVVAFRAAKKISVATGRTTTSEPPLQAAPAGELAKLRQYVVWGTRSAWGRRTLVGRLRVLSHKISRCVRSASENTAQDEVDLSSLLDAPESKRSAHTQGAFVREILAFVEQQAERMHRRPQGGR
jgi:hypothetical protein